MKFDINELKKLVFKSKSSDDEFVDKEYASGETTALDAKDTKPKDGAARVQKKPKAGLVEKISAEEKYYIENLTPFLPGELIGGGIPYVAGLEEEAVWNAAAQACATEKVHYVYSVEDNKVWYLACPSTALASAPDSWCPLAAALPGNSEYWDRESVYIYEKDGLAAALRWDSETGRMQIFFGAARTILPRLQTMEANFITINPQTADIIPWKSKQLRTEQLGRGAARLLMISGILTSLVLLGVMAIQFITINFLDRKLSDVKTQSEEASMQLMTKATELSQNELLKHTVRVQQLLDDLSKIDGTLVRYEVKGGVVEWEALVPAAYSTGVMSVRGQAQPGIEDDGRIRIKGQN